MKEQTWALNAAAMDRDSLEGEDVMVSHSDVERRAYELYERRGGELGHDLDDWYEAERELGMAEPLDESESNLSSASVTRQGRRQRSAGLVHPGDLDRS
jgi:hypothetical protein